MAHAQPACHPSGQDPCGKKEGWASDYRCGNQYVFIGTGTNLPSKSGGLKCMPEERSWVPEVFIREGINFTIDDPTRVVYSPHKANLIAAQMGIQ